MLQNFLQSTWKTEYAKLNNTRIIYTDDNKSKYYSNPKDILRSAKKVMKNSTTNKLPQLLLLNFFAKFLTERKYLMNTLIFARRSYL